MWRGWRMAHAHAVRAGGVLLHRPPEAESLPPFANICVWRRDTCGDCAARLWPLWAQLPTHPDSCGCPPPLVLLLSHAIPPSHHPHLDLASACMRALETLSVSLCVSGCRSLMLRVRSRVSSHCRQQPVLATVHVQLSRAVTVCVMQDGHSPHANTSLSVVCVL